MRSFAFAVAALCWLAVPAAGLMAQTGSGLFQAAVDVPGTTVERVEGELLLPATGDVDAVIIFISRGLSKDAFESAEWRRSCARVRCGLLHARIVGPERPPVPTAQQVIRNAEVGGARGLVSLLDSLAALSGHEALTRVPLIIWGFSAAGNFGVTFAAAHPGRTAAFVRYHSSLRDLPVDIGRLVGIPALILAGERDDVAGVEDSEQFWLAGRAQGAPWTYVLEPGAEHYAAPEDFNHSVELQIAWVEAVLRQRIGPGGELQGIGPRVGLLGDHATGEYFERSGAEAPRRTSWLPDERTAREWQRRSASRLSRRIK
jgi:hypothetical protein